MSSRSPDVREQRTVGSALWAAFGDALGFPTELASSTMVQRRLGSPTSIVPTSWKRRVGGKYGVDVTIPPGGYSDDTQLRLATCRSLRGDGEFDVETFSKVELPVWLAYCLGAGRGSKAAAANLTSKKVAWFGNFFDVPGSNYVSGGGNGAAMRVQPHVWAAENLCAPSSFLADVARNAVTTHGHMRGIGGALIHAVSLASVLQSGRIPVVEDWFDFADAIKAFASIVDDDEELSDFWRPTWEKKAGYELKSAIDSAVDEWVSSVAAVAKLPLADPERSYAHIVESLGGLTDEERGSGLKTALFSLVAASNSSLIGPRRAIEVSANLLGSDTDTIASMAAALVGASDEASGSLPEVQDAEYIRMEAERTYQISQRAEVTTFVYPDLLYWSPPKGPLDSVGDVRGQLTLAGLGRLTAVPHLEGSRQKDTVWQWYELPFGQTLLCRHRVESKGLNEASVPERAILQRRRDVISAADERAFVSKTSTSDLFSQSSSATIDTISLDALTDAAIKSQFDPFVLGSHLLRLIEAENGMELAIGYAATIAKAKRARLKKNF
jgi:ADP-ribosylglycohydrolase